METENILEGIAIIVTCVIGAWQLWLAVVTRNARIAILTFAITASLVTLIIILWDGFKISFEPKEVKPPKIIKRKYIVNFDRCIRIKDGREGYENLGCRFEIANQREIPRDQSGRLLNKEDSGKPALYVSFGEPNTNLEYAKIVDPKDKSYNGIVSDGTSAPQRYEKFAYAEIPRGTKKELWVLFKYPEEYKKVSKIKIDFRAAFYGKPSKKYKLIEWEGRDLQIES